MNSTRLIFTVVAAVIVLLGVVYLNARLNEQQAAQRDATTALIGDEGLAHCREPVARADDTNPVPDTVRVAFVDLAEGMIAEPYHSALPAATRADDANPPTVLACVVFRRALLSTETIDDSNSALSGVRCDRFRRDINVRLVNAQTGMFIAGETFNGDLAGPCPASSRESTAVAGPLPAADVVFAWLTAQVGGATE